MSRHGRAALADSAEDDVSLRSARSLQSEFESGDRPEYELSNRIRGRASLDSRSARRRADSWHRLGQLTHACDRRHANGQGFDSAQVEVMGHYSKLSDQGERVRVLLEMVPQGGSEPIVRTPKQVQKHLDPAAVDELVAAYRGGSTLRDLASRYGVHRHTVRRRVACAGLTPRYRALGPAEVVEATRMYASGMSLAAVSGLLGVHANTVRSALIKAGIRTRDSHGRDRQ
jgi:transposase-like protein